MSFDSAYLRLHWRMVRGSSPNWIQAKEKEMVSEAEGLIQTLEKELDELKMTETEARQLPHIEDVPHFFQVRSGAL
jgi:hypothetical protein